MNAKPRHPVSIRRSAAPTLLGAVLLSAGLTGGCQDTAARPGMTGESVFELFTPPSPVDAARWAADPFDADKRQRGTLLLANAPFGGERVYVALYETALDDADAAVRAVGVRALAMHGDASHAQRIARLLRQDPSASVRWEAARALQRLHDPGVVDVLLRAVDARHESDSDTRAAAAIALGQYAQTRVFQGLISALTDRRLIVNQSALKSLRVLTGQDHGFSTRAWLEWSRGVDDIFAQRGEYIYPVFRRDPNIVEMIVPWVQPPNERPATPAGMTPQPQAVEQERGS